MQRGVQLLPPSHFSTLAPPSTFQPRPPSVAVAVKCEPESPPASIGMTYSSHAARKTEDVSATTSSQSAVDSATGSSGRRSAETQSFVALPPPLATSSDTIQHQLTGVGACASPQKLETFSHRPRLKGRSREEGDRLQNWLPPNTSHSKNEVARYHHDAAIRRRNRETGSTTEREKATVRSSERRSTAPVDHGFRENAEEALARKLAMCQKIDKSLQFYADVRKKWSEGPSTTSSQPSSTETRNSFTNTQSSVDAKSRQHSDACAKVARNQVTPTATSTAEKDGRLQVKREGAPRSDRVQKELSKAAVYHSQRTSDSSGGRKTRVDRRKPTQSRELAERRAKPPSSRSTLNDLSRLPSSRTWTKTVTSTSKPPLTLTLRLPQQPSAPAHTDPKNALSSSNKATEVTSSPTEKVQSPQTVVPVTDLLSPVPIKPQKYSCTEPETPSLTAISATATTTATSSPSVQQSEKVSEEFNDFDSVQQESDSESVEPLTGTFGEPILTGAQPILSPLSPLKSTELPAAVKPATSRQSSCEEEVRRKQLTSTHNDTVIARVLQAEEESRAGVSLTPNTSNDLAIARHIQEDLDQLALSEDQPSGAVGIGPPPPPPPSATADSTMSYKSNFESLRFLSDDPNYYGKGYEIGREFMVTGHNSLSEEQRERNRNIPRKSVRRNNYSGRWDDEYRYRGFDERGYRNMSTERFQPHERKTWAVGGTGIVTACVRDMRRSDALLEREEIDLAFEGRQELEEIESSIDSELIERMSHQYQYKEKHRPKDPSVKPVTECAICLEDFNVGDPLRLMPCSHTFHRFCVDKWLEEKVSCPVCKADYHSLAGKLGLKVDLQKYKRRYW